MKDLHGMNLQLFAGEEDDFILPDDVQEPIETAEPQADEILAEDTNPAPEPQAEPYKFKVKFNHEEMELGEDEAVPLIQKGMNYDKLQERYNQIQSDPRLSKYDKVSQVSQLLGYQSDDQLIDALYQNYYQLTAQQRGLTPQQIQREHELNQERQMLQREKQAAQQQRQNNAMFERLLQAFPDIQTKDIKPETWAKVKQGMDLTAAYVEQQNAELREKYKVLEQKLKNKDTAPVSGVTKHGGTNVSAEDDFLKGFNSI